jgi:two-component system chemotaxis response regulator CheY
MDPNPSQIIEALTEATGRPAALNACDWPILFIDDSADQRQLMEMLFRGSGFPLLTKADAQNLVECVREHKIRLIYLDLNLGAQNGLQILQELKQNPATAKLPVLMITATSDRETILRAVQGGCDGYLVKPLNESILAKTHEILGKHYLGNDSIRSALKQYPAGVELISDQRKQRNLFIIKSGRVRVQIHRQGQDVVLATLGPGDIFGEESFLTGDLPSANVFADSDVTVVQLETTAELDRYWTHNAALKEIFSGIIRKLRKANENIALLSRQNRLTTRHLGVDLTAEALYREVRRLLTLTKAVFVMQGPKAKFSGELLCKQLEQLVGETPLKLSSFVRTLVQHGLLGESPLAGAGATAGGAPIPVPGGAPGPGLPKEISPDLRAIEAMLQRLETAVRERCFVILDPIAVNVLNLLDALRRDKGGAGPFTIAVSLVNPSSSPEIHDSLRLLGDLGLIEFCENDTKQIVYAPTKLNVFLKWHGVLMDLAPPQLARAGRPPGPAGQKE